MALETTLSFGQAVKAGDYSSFYNAASLELRKRFTLQQFTQAFNGFLQQKTNLLAVRNYVPVFNPDPRLSEDGTLVIQGYFPTQPSRVNFDYEYLRSSDEWKISGIHIDVTPVGNEG